MKYALIFLSLILTDIAIAQSDIPEFLQGTWKMENKDIFERWDKLNDDALKGFSYKIEKGLMKVSEYLDISRDERELIYTATVLNQNEGKGINFWLTNVDSAYTFANTNHDFPKFIIYQKLTDTEIFVTVSDGKDKGFSYKMIKQH